MPAQTPRIPRERLPTKKAVWASRPGARRARLGGPLASPLQAQCILFPLTLFFHFPGSRFPRESPEKPASQKKPPLQKPRSGRSGRRLHRSDILLFPPFSSDRPTPPHKRSVFEARKEVGGAKRALSEKAAASFPIVFIIFLFFLLVALNSADYIFAQPICIFSFCLDLGAMLRKVSFHRISKFGLHLISVLSSGFFMK